LTFIHRRSYERLRKKFGEIVVDDQRLFENPEKVNLTVDFLKEKRKKDRKYFP